jgi:hypothetical protein
MKYAPQAPAMSGGMGLGDPRFDLRIAQLERGRRRVFTPKDQVDTWISHPHFREAPILLDYGRWDVHSPLLMSADNTHLIGSGYHSVIRMGSANQTFAMNISGNGVVIENVRFVRDIAPTVYLLQITGEDVTIRNCWFESSGASGCILANVADRLTIDSCIVSGGARDMIYVLDSDESVITDNRLIPPAGYGAFAINLDSTNTAVAAQRCNDAIVANNHIGAHAIRYNNTGVHLIADNNNTATPLLAPY